MKYIISLLFVFTLVVNSIPIATALDSSLKEEVKLACLIHYQVFFTSVLEDLKRGMSTEDAKKLVTGPKPQKDLVIKILDALNTNDKEGAEILLDELIDECTEANSKPKKMEI